MEIDLNEAFLKQISEAASESDWIPSGYTMNEILSDVCSFLRYYPAPKVKPLVWGKTSYGSPETYPEIGGVYRIVSALDGGFNCHERTSRIISHDGRSNHATIEEAKAAAQADYERRILSALE